MMKLLLLLLLCGLVAGKLQLNFDDNKIQVVQGENGLKEFLELDKRVKLVYFFVKEVKHIRIFIRELKKSAEFLDLYGVKIAFVNCSDESSKQIGDCSKADVEKSVYTYRAGIQLLPLELETMFDVNSIMSNVLQLVMLREVPILQDMKEVEKYLKTLRGKKDVVFGHMKAIGTVEHRVFMEVAYAYMDKLQFIVSTDRKATKLFEQPPKRMGKDISSVWWVWTKQAGETSTKYHNVRYRGDFNLKSLATFASTILKPRMFDIPAQGMEHPFAGYEVPVVRIYYNMESREQAYQSADSVSRSYGGMLGIVLINMEDPEVKKLDLYQGQIPTLSFMKTAESAEHFLPTGLESDNIARFIEEGMGSAVHEMGSEGPMEGLQGPPEHPHKKEFELDMAEDQATMDKEGSPFVNADAVEQQDDKVADAVEKTKSVAMPLDRVPALRDTTFRDALKLTPTAVILLYHPFDAVSMGNLRMFGEAADMLGEQTALTIRRVNCYDWTDVCQAEKIIFYPTLRVYKDGKQDWDYSGPQDTKAMFATLKLLELSAPVYVSDGMDLMKYLDGTASVTDITKTVVTGLFSKDNKQEIQVFKQVAAEVQVKERILFVYSDIKDTSNIAKSVSCSVPCVVLSRYEDTVQPYVSFAETFTTVNLKQFVRDNKLPKLTLLTPLMLPTVREKFSDLAILFTDQSESCQKSEDVLREVIKTQKFSNVSFNMMPVPDSSSVGYRVLKKYTEEPEIPYLSLVKFQKGEVFNFGRQDFEVDSVSHWLSEVVQGDIQPSAMLQKGEWKPLNRGYEYLKIIDFEKEQAKKNKHGKPGAPELPMDEVPSEHTLPLEVEERERRLPVDDSDDSEARRELFDLRTSRLYHQAPGRSGHHGDHHGRAGSDDHEKPMKESHQGTDAGEKAMHQGTNAREKETMEDQKIPKATEDNKKKHDPSEL